MVIGGRPCPYPYKAGLPTDLHRWSSGQVTVDAVSAVGTPQRGPRSASAALAAAVLGFFVVTFDAVVVNVALPSIGEDLGGGMTGLQWVVDGYTLLFARVLLSSAAISDRIGARRAFGVGMGVFVVASAACGCAPTITVLVAARFVQGAAAALIIE